VEIVLPDSHSAIKLPESNVMMITLSKDNRILLGFDSQNMRARIFGAANQFRGSMEVTTKELPNMLIQARIANPQLRTVVKGDKEADYGVAEDVMNILQKTNITRFNLVTDLKKD